MVTAVGYVLRAHRGSVRAEHHPPNLVMSEVTIVGRYASTARAVLEAMPSKLFALMMLVTVVKASVPMQSGSTCMLTASLGLRPTPSTAYGTAGASQWTTAGRSPLELCGAWPSAEVAEEASSGWAACAAKG